MIKISDLLQLSFRKFLCIHPNVHWASVEGRVGGSSDGLGGEVELSIVGITVNLEAMAAEDLSKWEHVQDEGKGTKHRTLGDSMGDRNYGRFAVVD